MMIGHQLNSIFSEQNRDIFGTREDQGLAAFSITLDTRFISAAQHDQFCKAFNPLTENRVTLFFNTLLEIHRDERIKDLLLQIENQENRDYIQKQITTGKRKRKRPKTSPLTESRKLSLKLCESNFINSIDTILTKIATSLELHQQYQNNQRLLIEHHTALKTEISTTIERLRSKNDKAELMQLRTALKIGSDDETELKATLHSDLLRALYKQAPKIIGNALNNIVVLSLSPPTGNDVYQHALNTAETILIPFLAHACNIRIAAITPEQRTQKLSALMFQVYDLTIIQAKQLKQVRRKEQTKRKDSYCELWGTKEALTALMIELIEALEGTTTPANPATMVALFYQLQIKFEEEYTNAWVNTHQGCLAQKRARISTHFSPLSYRTVPSYLLVAALLIIVGDVIFDSELSNPKPQVDKDLMIGVLTLAVTANLMIFFQKTKRDLALSLGQAPTWGKIGMSALTSIKFTIATAGTYLTREIAGHLAMKSYDPSAESQPWQNTTEVAVYTLATYLFIGLASYTLAGWACLLTRAGILGLNACGYLPNALGARRFNNTPERPHAADIDMEPGLEIVRPMPLDAPPTGAALATSTDISPRRSNLASPSPEGRGSRPQSIRFAQEAQDNTGLLHPLLPEDTESAPSPSRTVSPPEVSPRHTPPQLTSATPSTATPLRSVRGYTTPTKKLEFSPSQ